MITADVLASSEPPEPFAVLVAVPPLSIRLPLSTVCIRFSFVSSSTSSYSSCSKAFFVRTFSPSNSSRPERACESRTKVEQQAQQVHKTIYRPALLAPPSSLNPPQPRSPPPPPRSPRFPSSLPSPSSHPPRQPSSSSLFPCPSCPLRQLLIQRPQSHPKRTATPYPTRGAGRAFGGGWRGGGRVACFVRALEHWVREGREGREGRRISAEQREAKKGQDSPS